MFSRFSSKKAIEFGASLAHQLSKQYPPSMEQPHAPKISANRMSRILEDLYAQAQTFRLENRIGFIRRARLSHAFKWQLIELGYSTKFIDMATEGLVVYLHKALVTTPEQASAQEKRVRRAEKRARESSPPVADQYSRSNPSPRYLELSRLYRQMHEQGESFLNLKPEETFPGLSLPPQAARIKRLIDATHARRILDYGSGKGLQYEARNVALPEVPGTWPSVQDYWGVESVHCYDPAFAPFSDLPRGAFDGVISTDVLEHCPEEDMPWILDEIFSYARKFVFANVACYPAKKRLPTGENAHCTIQPKAWWEAQIGKVADKHPGIRYEFWVQWKDAQGKLVEDVIRSQ